MEKARKVLQVVMILAGCLAICFALVSIVMSVLFAQGFVAQSAVLPLDKACSI